MDPRYPIGQFEHRGPVSTDERERWLGQIEALPGEMLSAVAGLDDAQLDTRYRPGGWTLRQVVHHVPDSHLNAYVRFIWTLTEEVPLVKPYDEARLAELPYYRELPVAASLDFLDRVHRRWLVLLRSLGPDELARRLRHPDFGAVDLAWMIGHYAWHGRHHLAHITTTVERQGWGKPA